MAAAPALDATVVSVTPARDHTKPADLSHHLNRTTRNRKASAIKSLYKYFQVPGMTNLAGGMALYLVRKEC
jgi:hypothetical protein